MARYLSYFYKKVSTLIRSLLFVLQQKYVINRMGNPEKYILLLLSSVNNVTVGYLVALDKCILHHK